MPCQITTAILLAILIPTALSSPAAPPDLTFLCDEMPEICQNMCWAVRCARPSFPQSFTIDISPQPVPPRSGSTNPHHGYDRFHVSADCPGDSNSTCSSPPPPGYETNAAATTQMACNMYPFSHTRESALFPGSQVTRCVPLGEQNAQDRQLKVFSWSLSRSNLTQPRRYTASINFGNPGMVRYCNNDPCVNDGFENQNGTALGRRSGQQQQPSPPLFFKYYKALSGMVIASVEDIETPSHFTRRVGKNEVVSPDFDTWYVDAAGEHVHMVGDVITERVAAHTLN